MNFGMNASSTKIIPAHTPTLRDATPVRLIIATLGEAVMVGIVPARPEIRLLRPLTLRPPWTSLKSLASGWRRETRCTAPTSATALKEVIIVITTNAGRSAQNLIPKVKSSPGHAFSGNPNQAESWTMPNSYSPNGTPMAHPNTIPIIGAHICNALRTLSSISATTARVTIAARGAAIVEESSGTSVRVLKTARITVAAMSISTVPETTGVMIRRNSESRNATANFTIDERTIRLDIIAGPPSIRAVMQMAIAGSAVPTTRT